jgi:translation initiation factor 2B subunit (eIF-2B alpha/beta/delta family)
MPDFVSDVLNERLKNIQNHVKNKWENNIHEPWHTFHDASHNQEVEKKIYDLIPKEKRNQIDEKEWFYLLSATWLHDIGMILNLFGQDDDFKQVRDTHHERSVKYIMDNHDVLGLDKKEASIISQICKYHRKSLDIKDLKKEVGNIRLRLLAAYLRLADALHIDSTRISDSRYKLLVALEMPWENRFHWIKSKWVQSVIPKHDSMKICITVFDLPIESPRQGLLPQLVTDEIIEELNSVKDVLIRGKISYFSDIETNTFDPPLDGEDRIELELVLGNIELENISSASEAVECIANSFIRLAAEPGPATFDAIRKYLSQMENVLEARPCHIMIKNILKRIDMLTQNGNLSEEVRQNRVKKIKEELESATETRNKMITQLSINAQPILMGSDSILLFGYSKLVIRAMNDLPKETKERIQIYVAECRGKSMYNQANEFHYCDGLNYAEKVRNGGFPKVAIIPDISIANLMARDLIGKVVFGANGIDLSGKFGHTAGHLGIAVMAKQYNVPVYVIADTAKFGKLEWNADKERNIQWLTRDKKSLDLMKKHTIKTINPREDIIDPHLIKMLITEDGVFPPDRIPKSIKSRIVDTNTQ